MHGPSPQVSVAHGCIIQSGFRAHPLLRNPHLQTLYPALVRPMPELEIRQERLELADGDFVDLGWSGNTQGTGPLAILLHGLTGGFDSKYLRGTARLLIARGWRTVALQFRGGGEEPNRLPRSVNHGDTGDLLHLCRLLREREPGTPLYAVGWSMGANILLKALGEEGDRALIRAAVAVSAPFQLLPCAERLRTGFSRVYQNHLIDKLNERLRRKHGPVPLLPGASLEATLKARDFIEFDNAYTAPMNGYPDALQYYSLTSCGRFLHGVRRPTLVINALDDPFMNRTVVPAPQELAPQVTVELSERGGHVGFIGADRRGRPHYWMEARIAEYLFEAAA